MYYCKALLAAVLVLGNSCLANSEYYLEVRAHSPHGPVGCYGSSLDRQAPRAGTILLEYVSNTMPIVGVAYAVCSFMRSVFGGSEKPQQAQEVCPPAQHYNTYSYPPGHPALQTKHSDVYATYYIQDIPPVQVVPAPAPEPAKPVDIRETKKQHLQQQFEQQSHDLAAYDAECTSELTDYFLVTDHYHRLKKRSDALKDCQTSPYYSETTHTISDNARRLLQEQKIADSAYRTCYGNQLQQALHEEVLTIIAQTADIYYAQSSMQQFPLTELLIDFTDLGRECNRSGSVVKALTTLDACWHVLDCMHAVAEGVAQGAWKTLRALSNPVKFMNDMLHGITTVARYIALVVVEVGDISITFCVDRPHGCNKFNKACEHISTVYKAIWATLRAMPARELIKEGTSFATECYLSGKALTAAGSFYNKAKKYASMFKKGAKDYSRAVITTPEGFTFHLADETANMLKMSAENAFTGRVVKNAGQICPELPIILDIEKRVDHLKQLFYCPKNMLAKLEGVQYLTFNFEHIFGIEIIEMYKKGFLKTTRLSGFHHDYMGKIEQCGLVKYVKQKAGPLDSFCADVIINGQKFEGKSFFPRLWSDEKIIQKILESLENLSSYPELQANGKWSFVGTTTEKLKIQTIIDQLGNIITSYPIIE